MKPYTLKKINNVKVVPIEVNKLKLDEIKGYDLIPILYSNIFICGKKKSGKTNVLWTILRNTIDEETIVVIFCSIHNSDSNWIMMRDWLEKKKQPHLFYWSIVDDDTGVFNFSMLREKIEADDAINAKANISTGGVTSSSMVLFGSSSVDINNDNKEEKKKKIAPKYVVIFNDISDQLRNKKDIQTFFKINRHLKAKVIVSSQFPTDINPAARSQVDIWAIFGGFSKDRMETVFPQLDLSEIEFDQFYYYLYKKIIGTPHHFLYIDREQNQLRENFDLEIIVKTQSL